MACSAKVCAAFSRSRVRSSMDRDELGAGTLAHPWPQVGFGDQIDVPIEEIREEILELDLLIQVPRLARPVAHGDVDVTLRTEVRSDSRAEEGDALESKAVRQFTEPLAGWQRQGRMWPAQGPARAS